MTLERVPETLGSVGWIHIVGKRGPTTCGILAISYYPSSQETPFGFYFGVVIGGVGEAQWAAYPTALPGPDTPETQHSHWSSSTLPLG